jgi:hypothetical protein
VVDADGDGDIEFARLARNWHGATSLHDEFGRALWISGDYDAISAIQETLLVDMDKDGALEFLMYFGNSDIVRLVGNDGTVIWEQKWGRKPALGSIVVANIDHDDDDEIVYADGVAIVTRDREGLLLHEAQFSESGYANYVRRGHLLPELGQNSMIAGQHRAGWGQEYFELSSDSKAIGARIESTRIEHFEMLERVSFETVPEAAYAAALTLKQGAPIAGHSATAMRLRILGGSGSVMYEQVVAPSSNFETVGTGGALHFLGNGGDGNGRLLVAYGSQLYELLPSK